MLLRNKRVMVHSNVTPPSKKSMSFEQIWVPMVPQLGGEIVSEMPDEGVFFHFPKFLTYLFWFLFQKEN